MLRAIHHVAPRLLTPAIHRAPKVSVLSAAVTAANASAFSVATICNSAAPQIHSLTGTTIDGRELAFSSLANKPLLILNVASR